MSIKEKIARWLVPGIFETYEIALETSNKNAVLWKKEAEDAQFESNRRYAKLVAEMDPFEALFSKLSIVFSKEFTKPGDDLDDPSLMRLAIWAYKENNDPQFNYLLDWIINSHGNETFKSPAKTKEELADRMLYGKAQISSMKLLKKEVGRLSSIYEEYLKKLKGGDDFDEGDPVG